MNISPCLATDPEYKRIVDAFKTSNLSWSTFVKELVVSPITTNASVTATTSTNGGVIAVSRRDHLCAALNSRLGLIDICGLSALSKKGAVTIPEIVAGLPSDGYGRGATIPVLPNQPTLFYRARLENICSAVATQLVDAAANPAMPDAKH